MSRNTGPGRREKPTRADRRAAARRRRARAHLARMRGAEPKRRAAPRWLPGLVLAISLAAGGATASLWRVGAVESVHLQGAAGIPTAELAQAIGFTPGEGAAALDARAVARRLPRHPRIDRARALRLPTGALLVELSERAPVAVVLAGDPPTAFAVDERGTLFAEAREEDLASLPRVAAAGATAPGDTDERLADAAALARQLSDRGLARPEEVSVAAEGDPEGYALRLAGIAAPVVLGWRDLDAKLDALVRVLASSASEIASAERIDLRFADQAVLRQRPSS